MDVEKENPTIWILSYPPHLYNFKIFSFLFLDSHFFKKKFFSHILKSNSGFLFHLQIYFFSTSLQKREGLSGISTKSNINVTIKLGTYQNWTRHLVGGKISFGRVNKLNRISQNSLYLILGCRFLCSRHYWALRIQWRVWITSILKSKCWGLDGLIFTYFHISK